MLNKNIVIVGAKRTPMGAFQGVLSSLTAAELGASAIQAAVSESQIDSVCIDEVIMGNVLSAGQGQAPARQASLGAGISDATGCTTINKMCGSGMKAVMLAHDLIMAGSNSIMVAGGMESMSNAPYLLPKVRQGVRMGHGEMQDHMFLDGLEDAYDRGKLMGTFAENCAEKFQFTREQQDEFAIASLKKAQNAIKNNYFNQEVTEITSTVNRKEVTIETDESPFSVQIDKIPNLRPAFRKDGSVTAANSSSISDGASALVLMKEEDALSQGYQPLARIVGHTTHAHAPEWFTTAPVGAIEKCLMKTGWSASEVDLFEINEAFAVVTMAAMTELSLPSEKVNIHGGACALGHPIGASGARILVTLIHALKRKQLDRGIAALCIGGGEATAIAIENIK